MQGKAEVRSQSGLIFDKVLLRRNTKETTGMGLNKS